VHLAIGRDEGETFSWRTLFFGGNKEAAYCTGRCRCCYCYTDKKQMF